MSSGPTAARRAAFEVLRRTFEHGAWADRAFRSAASRHRLAGRDLAFAHRLSYGAVQRRGTTDAVVDRLSSRPAAELDPPVIAALRLGLYELLFAGGTPDHAAVDQAVELAKQGGAGRGAGLVNAILRRAAREKDDLLGELRDDTPETAAIAHSAPGWLAEMWFREQGADLARSLLTAANEPAETAMRVSAGADRATVLGELGEAGVEARAADGPPPLAAGLIVIDGAMGEATINLIDAGTLTPQSRGSAAVVEVLDPQPGERILDLCAGPGVKTTAIGERTGIAEVLAVEIDEGRAAEVVAGAERLGVENIRVVNADALEAELAGGFDAVLVDAPCSDLGTLASRPDVRWRKSPTTIEQVAELQAALLRRGAELLRPGGRLVYATCTISLAENEDQIEALLAEAPDELAAEDLGARFPDLASGRDPRSLQIRPDRDRTSGFFIAALRRND